eukprot:scaffold133540_cov20-Tisochrysis_lutea.AAC.1
MSFSRSARRIALRRLLGIYHLLRPRARPLNQFESRCRRHLAVLLLRNLGTSTRGIGLARRGPQGRRRLAWRLRLTNCLAKTVQLMVQQRGALSVVIAAQVAREPGVTLHKLTRCIVDDV